MIFFQIAMLGVTFFVMQYHITKGVQSKTHRLLPLLSATIAVYDFYEIVKYMTNAWDIFRFLEILLVMQMVYVIFFYIIDFTHINLPFHNVIILFVILCSVDITILYVYPDPIYYVIYLYYLSAFVLLNFLIFTYYLFRYNFGKQESTISILSYLAVLIPMITLILSKLKILNQDIAMPLSLSITLLIFFYLMKQDMLSDTVAFLQEGLYNDSQNAYILTDQYFYFLTANDLAYKLFPEGLKKLENGKQSERLVPKVKESFEKNGELIEYQHGDRYYACSINAKYSKEVLKGYIITLMDITHQKNELFLAEELKRSAEYKNIQKSRIMIQTSHDLRSPLHNIIGCCDILMRKLGINGEHLNIITQIKSASKNLLSLVNDMLEFTRMEFSNQDTSKLTDSDIVLESSSGFLPMPEYSEYKARESSDANPTYTYPKARVLVVDDMKLNLYIFKELTSPWQFSIDTAADGQEAIDAVKKQHYDLIFLDRLMPNVDGLEACISIKELTQTPIVLLSANTSEYDIAEYEPYGFSDYVSKPFTVERLKVVIEKHLSSSLRKPANPDASSENGIDHSSSKIDNNLFWGEDNTEEDLVEKKPAASASDPSTVIASTVASSPTLQINVSPTVLGSYVNELTEVQNNLELWLDQDIDMYRTKVHGIKGISRQIGFIDMGEESEIMEMAAKANHLDYIRRHLPEYQEKIQGTLDYARKAYADMGGLESESDDDLFDNF